MTLGEFYKRYGDEIPLWEALHELDPPIEERLDAAAWNLARAAKSKAIYRRDFCGVVLPPRPPQSVAEMAAEAEQIFGKPKPK